MSISTDPGIQLQRHTQAFKLPHTDGVGANTTDFNFSKLNRTATYPDRTPVENSVRTPFTGNAPVSFLGAQPTNPPPSRFNVPKDFDETAADAELLDAFDSDDVDDLLSEAFDAPQPEASNSASLPQFNISDLPELPAGLAKLSSNSEEVDTAALRKTGGKEPKEATVNQIRSAAKEITKVSQALAKIDKSLSEIESQPTIDHSRKLNALDANLRSLTDINLKSGLRGDYIQSHVLLSSASDDKAVKGTPGFNKQLHRHQENGYNIQTLKKKIELLKFENTANQSSIARKGKPVNLNSPAGVIEYAADTGALKAREELREAQDLASLAERLRRL